MTSAVPAEFRVFHGIAFPVTICALFFGPHHDLAQRCLRSIYARTDPRLFHLRAGLNSVCHETRQLVESIREEYGNVTVFDESENIYKNPLMRRMFRRSPITTEWVVWFDDDSHVTRPDWLFDLALRIESHADKDIFGRRMYIEVGRKARDFIESAPWYRGLPLQPWTDHEGREESRRIDFVTGGFWATRTRTLHKLDWPDPRIIQDGEDYLLGEAMRQNGFRTGHFDSGVRISDGDRRNAFDKNVSGMFRES